MHLHDLLQDYITCLICARPEQEQVGALVDLLGGLVARGENCGLKGVDRFKHNLKAYRVRGAGVNTLTNDVVALTQRLLDAQALKERGQEPQGIFRKL